MNLEEMHFLTLSGKMVCLWFSVNTEKFVNLSWYSRHSFVGLSRNWHTLRCAFCKSILVHWAIWLVIPPMLWYLACSLFFAGSPPSDSITSTLPGFAGLLGCLFPIWLYPNLSWKRLIFTGCVSLMNCFVRSILHQTYLCRALSRVLSVMKKSCPNAFASLLMSFPGPVIKQLSTCNRGTPSTFLHWYTTW